MPFVLDTSGSFLWPISYESPSDGGLREKQSFSARFKRLPQSRITQIQQEANGLMAAAERGDDITDRISDVSIANEVLIGWEDVKDEEGNDIPFNKSTKKKLLDVPMLASVIVESYFTSLVEEKRKN